MLVQKAAALRVLRSKRQAALGQASAVVYGAGIAALDPPQVTHTEVAMALMNYVEPQTKATSLRKKGGSAQLMD